MSIVASGFWNIQSLIGSVGPYAAISCCSGNARPPPLAAAFQTMIGRSPASFAAASTASNSATVAGGSVMPIWVANSLL